jgi:nucleoside-diphosphate-sugar epimerase
MAEKVLVTGGFGLVGSQAVRHLVWRGHRVVASDLGTRAQRKAAASLPAGAEARWADLTDAAEIERIVAETEPTVIINLAAAPWSAIRARLGEPRCDTIGGTTNA